ncbi:MAG TPA: hypothetical protein PLI09_07635 [Candidatus Hydrogenedentes bacterium]|nr:hypothetical protein [Candidatus Hydrogenedentota bacterium]
MKIRHYIVVGGIWMLLVSTVVAETYTIPVEKVDAKKVYWGSASSFQKPAKVDYERVVKATPEYVSIKKNKIEQNSAKYWILVSKASNHAVRLIAEAAKDGSYDFIAASSYLGNLQPPIPADDITDLVLKKMEQTN